MNKEDLVSKIKSIRENNTDEALVSSTLTEVFDGISELFTQVENTENINSELTQSNEKLKQANMELFLKVTSEPGSITPEIPPANEPQKRKFEDLFNDKGGLK